MEGWEAIYNNPAIWHFRFNGPTPEALVKGRERIYFEHFWNDFAADKTRSIPEADRQAYTAAYARPGRMRAGWAYFVSFQQAAKDFARLSQTKLTMPVLSIGGEKANGDALGEQVKLVATNATIRRAAQYRALDHGGESEGDGRRADAVLLRSARRRELSTARCGCPAVGLDACRRCD